VMLIGVSWSYAGEGEWETLLDPSVRSLYDRFLKAYQEMDYVGAERTLVQVFQKAPSNSVVLWSYLFLAQNEGFGVESLEYGLMRNLVLYVKGVLSPSLPYADFLSRYVDSPRDRLATLVEVESQLKYVNWLVRLEIIKEHVNRNKDYGAAMDKLDDLAMRYPRFPVVHYYRLLFLLKQKKWEEFDSLARVTLKSFPRHPEILRLCGMAARERGRLDEAIQYYERALQANASWHADGMRELCQLYLEARQGQKLRALLQKARRLYPWDTDLGILEQRVFFGLEEAK